MEVLPHKLFVSASMSALSSLRSFMAPAGMQGVNAAAVTTPNIETALLTEEEQAQWDTDALVKALEEANRKRDELVNKRHNTQAAQEKRKADQCKADVKVRGRLLVNAAVAEVRCQYMCQANKARLAAEKLQTEWEASQSPWKVQMRLGVSLFFSSSLLLRLRKAAGYHCSSECGGRPVETEGA